MPHYNYECDECGHTLEIAQMMSDEPLKTCPECGKDTLEKLILGVACVQFRGSGFHDTDYDKHGPRKD
jgi:putative FmdB family regulatory protein